MRPLFSTTAETHHLSKISTRPVRWISSRGQYESNTIHPAIGNPFELVDVSREYRLITLECSAGDERVDRSEHRPRAI